jgi:large subunit ribosomal protein L31e
MVEEKILTINLRKKLVKTKKWKKAKNYLKVLRELLRRKFKTDKIKIDGKLNEKIWEKSIENPPYKLKIKVIKLDDGTIKAELV